jgi:hypothetical protein
MNRFCSKRPSDDQLDDKLWKINDRINSYESHERRIVESNEPMAMRNQTLDDDEQSLFLLYQNRERLLKSVDKRASRLARAVLSSRENTAK